MTASASHAELDNGCECASGIKRAGLAASAFTALSVMTNELRLCNGTSATEFTVLAPGSLLAPSDGDADVTLAVTGVVQAGDKIWRVVQTKGENGTVYHQVSAEDEEALISNAAKVNPDVKTSFTRWVSMSKNNEWPEQATPSELALFGPHCCISSALLEQKQRQKRARDAASRKRRATGNAPPAATADSKRAKVTITFDGTMDEVLKAIALAATQLPEANE